MNDETLLATELTRRADGIVAAPLTFEDVRGRAHGIRRRRRAVAAAAVAAAVAVAIIVPTVLTGGSDRSDGVDPAPSPSPSAAPAAVLHDGGLTLPDGGVVPIDLDVGTVSSFGVLADGRVVVARNRPVALQVYSAGGDLAADYPIGDTYLVMSPDDGAAAWMERDHSVHVLASGTADPVELGTVEADRFTDPMIDAVLDADRVLVGDGMTTTTEVTSDGVRELTTSDPLRVEDVSPAGDLWAVSFPPGDGEQYGCSGLYAPSTDRVVARSCKVWGLKFSPDGEHLLSGFYENNMASEVTVVDRDLRMVGTFDPAPEVISRAGWADAAHVLAAVAGLADNRWSLVRVGLDGGDPEVVAGPDDGRNPETVNEFLPSE
jgi:hypothetical protein